MGAVYPEPRRASTRAEFRCGGSGQFDEVAGLKRRLDRGRIAEETRRNADVGQEETTCKRALQQARLGQTEGEGGGRPYAGFARDASIRIQSGGKVDGNHRAFLT